MWVKAVKTSRLLCGRSKRGNVVYKWQSHVADHYYYTEKDEQDNQEVSDPPPPPSRNIADTEADSFKIGPDRRLAQLHWRRERACFVL